MGKLAEIKTRPTAESVEDYIQAIVSDQKRKDSNEILKMMQAATKEKPRMWGSSIIGFGAIRFKSPKTEREVDWFRIGFAPRKASLSIYLPGNMEDKKPYLSKLGKHKTGMGCLYINKLADVDIEVLKQLIQSSLK